MIKALLLPLALTPLGCALYGHTVDIAVNDPRAVWVESPRNGARAEPPGPGAKTRVAGTRDYVERDEGGAIDVDGRSVVGSDGWVSPPRTLDQTQRDGGLLRTPVCVHTRRGAGCTRVVWLATPMSNVTAMMERDDPRYWVGWLELLGGAALGGAGVALREAYPYASGGAILAGVGAVSALVGILQLLADPKNERVIVDPDE